LEATTLEFSTLLSRLYTAKSRHLKAAAVHVEVLRAILDEFQGTQEEELDTADTARIAIGHVEFLRHALHRAGGKHNDLTYKTLIEELNHIFGKEKVWVERAPTPLTRAPAKGTEKLGTWVPPTQWGFIIDHLAVSKKRDGPHLILKKRGASWALHSNGHSAAGSRVSSPDTTVD
jgi:hypothetical protein